jgi:arylsulfatase A-like enzyme
MMDAIQSTEGFADNTLTVYFSDHGDYCGSHGLDVTKVHHHEESVRVPAVFHWPAAIPTSDPTRSPHPGLFSLVDLFATTLELVGVEVPAYNQGTSFAPYLLGHDFTGPDAVLLEMVGSPRWVLRMLDWRGIVTDRHKYAYCETGREELFDLVSDPFELNNLAAKQPRLVAEMRARLLSMLHESGEPYFHVLMEHGVPPEGPVTDVSDSDEYIASVPKKGGIGQREER